MFRHPTLKQSTISPLLNKPNLDKDHLSNYRPISKLSLVSKIIEHVKSRLTEHLTSNNLLNPDLNSCRFFRSNSSDWQRCVLGLFRVLDVESFDCIHTWTVLHSYMNGSYCIHTWTVLVNLSCCSSMRSRHLTSNSARSAASWDRSLCSCAIFARCSSIIL